MTMVAIFDLCKLLRLDVELKDFIFQSMKIWIHVDKKMLGVV